MKQITYTIGNDIIKYDANHKGAHYMLPNGKYANHGDIAEFGVNYSRGFEYHNGNLRYNEGFDVPQLNASVKSGKASLATIYGLSFDDTVIEFCNNVKSSLFIFVMIWDNENGYDYTEYHMDLNEFVEFIYAFGSLQASSHSKGNGLTKMKIADQSYKMKRWFEDRIGA